MQQPPDPLTVRLALGATAAVAVAVGAYRVRSLTAGGAAAAVVVGTLAVGAGCSWAILLVSYFAATSSLSAFRSRERSARTAGLVVKGGARDAIQVAANGGVFAAAALGQVLLPAGEVPGAGGVVTWGVIGAGALAAAAADSWATEIGTLAGTPPRHLLTRRPVPAGTSGGVSPAGSAASLAGATFMAAITWLVGWGPTVAVAAGVAGVIGSLADSLLGASVQARRHCDRCDSPTERIVHGCGATTRLAGGIGWLDNDLVNLAATVVGAAVAWGVAIAAGAAAGGLPGAAR